MEMQRSEHKSQREGINTPGVFGRRVRKKKWVFLNMGELEGEVVLEVFFGDFVF